MGGTHAVIDVEAIGCAAYADHFGAELMKDLGCDVIRRAMRSIDHDLQTLEREVVGEGAFAKLDIAPCRVIQPARLAQLGRLSPDGRLLQSFFDRNLPRVGQLAALCAEKLDAVVGKSIVAGADDHAQAGPHSPRQVGHTGCGQGPQQHHVDTGGVKAGLKGAL